MKTYWVYNNRLHNKLDKEKEKGKLSMIEESQNKEGCLSIKEKDDTGRLSINERTNERTNNTN